MKKKRKTEKQIIVEKKQFSFPIWNSYFSIREQIGLFILVLVGLTLRIINAITIPLWRDEIYIFFTARNNSLWNLITQNHWDTAHPPLQSVFLHFWQMVSIQPFWLRLPSLLASFMILYLLPILAIKITQKYKALPYIFLFFFSFSHTHISLDMVARPYPFVSLFIIISLICFFELVKQKKWNGLNILKFGFINLMAIHTDYSVVWLFVSYFVYYVFNYTFNKKKVDSLKFLFSGLLFSALLSLSILPFLIGNINNSLDLEKYLKSKFNFSSTGIPSGSRINIHISNNNISFLDDKFNLVSKTVLPKSSFKKDLYLGLNLAPLSSLFIKEFKICSERRKENTTTRDIQTTFNTCHDKSKKSLINIKNIKSRRIIGTVFNKSDFSFFVSTKTNTWETPTSEIPIHIKENQDIYMSLSAIDLSFFEGAGLNFYDASPSKMNGAWKDVHRITISLKGGFYTTYLHNESIVGTVMMEGKNPLAPFIGDIYFLTNSPEIFYDSKLYMICLALFSIVFLYSLYKAFDPREQQLVIFIIMMTIPLILSFSVSLYGLPIFIAKNLFVVNISYLLLFSSIIARIGMFSRKNFNVYIFLVIVWMGIFFIKFPYLHFVDPPYDFGAILNEVNKQKNLEKYIILNSDNYLPLLKYGKLLNNSGKKILSTTIDKANYNDNVNIALKKKYQVFFLQFGIEKRQQGGEFSILKTKLNCNLKEMNFDYVYFARCD